MGAKNGYSDLRPDLHRALIKLDELPSGSIITDKYGDAWQKGLDYWYRAYAADGEASWTLAQNVGSITVLREGRADD